MKKSVLFLATAALFAACTNDSVRENIADDQVEIGFSTYIQKPVASKADNSTAETLKNLEAYHQNFVVNGFKTVATTETQVFANQLVTYADSKWGYSPVSYWDKSASKYSFYAAAPQTATWTFANDATKGKYYTISNFTVTGTSLALATRETPDAAAVFGTEDLMIATDIDNHTAFTTEAVNFTFNHILSRFNIAISTSISEGTVTLKSLTVNGMNNKGSFDESLAAASTAGSTARWNNLAVDGTYAITAVKDASNNDVVVNANKQFVYQGLVIPQTAAYESINLDGTSGETAPYLNIQYTIKTGESNEQSYSYYYNLAGLFGATAETPLAFNEGWQNNLYITIGAAAINFDAQVYEWATQTPGGNLEVQ
ncbi:MAG: fimbrillin family protein [Bacteroidaceae bacterium]|nr:fimbrillin family protein [Bacteroidaceae bacterium]